MSVFQWIVVPLLWLVTAATLGRLRGAVRGRRRLALSALLTFAAGVAVAFPGITITVARWLGIGRGADLLLYSAVLVGAWTALALYARYRRLEVVVTELARTVALDRAIRGGAPDEPPLGEDAPGAGAQDA